MAMVQYILDLNSDDYEDELRYVVGCEQIAKYYKTIVNIKWLVVLDSTAEIKRFRIFDSIAYQVGMGQELKIPAMWCELLYSILPEGSPQKRFFGELYWKKDTVLTVGAGEPWLEKPRMKQGPGIIESIMNALYYRLFGV